MMINCVCVCVYLSIYLYSYSEEEPSETTLYYFFKYTQNMLVNIYLNPRSDFIFLKRSN